MPPDLQQHGGSKGHDVCVEDVWGVQRKLWDPWTGGPAGSRLPRPVYKDDFTNAAARATFLINAHYRTKSLACLQLDQHLLSAHNCSRLHIFALGG